MNPLREYYRRLLQDARTVELRHFDGHRIASGRFADLDALLGALRFRGRSGAIYTSLNRPSALSASNAFQEAALRDADIGTIVRLPFDFDPDRPTDTPSTDRELAAAIAARDRFIRMMTAHGWPLPARGMSGNGAHALYRVCVVNDPAWRNAVDVIYRGARDRLELQGVKFDTSVRNPARIWRCYGTVNRKGTATDARPHRRASIVLPASAWQVVPVAQIEHVVRLWTPKEEPRRRTGNVVHLRDGNGDYRTLDVARWFRAHGLYRRELSEGKHAVVCPWSHEHSTADGPMSTATVVWEASGNAWPTFHCAHAHCEGRRIADVMALWPDADQFCSQQWEGRRRA